MLRKVRDWVYGDKSYYFAHLLIGATIAIAARMFFLYTLKEPISIILRLITNDTIALSAALLGFQLAGVSVLIALDGNKKLSLLKELGGDTMLYKVFLSSITMFLISIVMMLLYLNIFKAVEMDIVLLKSVSGYGSLIALLLGFVFLFSSIRLLKWLCSK